MYCRCRWPFPVLPHSRLTTHSSCIDQMQIRHIINHLDKEVATTHSSQQSKRNRKVTPRRDKTSGRHESEGNPARQCVEEENQAKMPIRPSRNEAVCCTPTQILNQTSIFPLLGQRPTTLGEVCVYPWRVCACVLSLCVKPESWRPAIEEGVAWEETLKE